VIFKKRRLDKEFMSDYPVKHESRERAKARNGTLQEQ